MKIEAMFAGFDPKRQSQHEQYLIERYGGNMKESIVQSNARVKNWAKKQWEESGVAFDEICLSLVVLVERRLPPDSREAQQAIRSHYEWLKRFWTPDRESYAGYSQLILDSDLRQAYAKYHRTLPEFTAAAIKSFAETELA